MLAKNVRNFLIGVLYIIPMFLANPACAKDIAKKTEIIAAADAHHIDSAVGGWSAFLKAHHLI